MYLSIKQQLYLRMLLSILLLVGMISLVILLVFSCLKQKKRSQELKKQEEALILVNKENPCPDNYYTKLVSFHGKMISRKMRDNLEQMMKDSCNDLSCLVIKATMIDENAIQEESIDSIIEHDTALAVDFMKDHDLKTNQKMWSWLEKHADEYGFIRHKEEEPWHYRFVGVSHAKNIKENHLTLEEYLKNYQKEGI